MYGTMHMPAFIAPMSRFALTALSTIKVPATLNGINCNSSNGEGTTTTSTINSSAVGADRVAITTTANSQGGCPAGTAAGAAAVPLPTDTGSCASISGYIEARKARVHAEDDGHDGNLSTLAMRGMCAVALSAVHSLRDEQLTEAWSKEVLCQPSTTADVSRVLYVYHHHITHSSHSISAIGPAPHRGGKRREHCSRMFACIAHIPRLDKKSSNTR
ncbi:hypothetical protein COO60DRAFT_966320 [Scenedesmus sp. NREL 46B-D3]|nr:hypothetical protein COO60DRAFT_966320 [Scenedesmus sp. NREL 46B-D3]